MQQAVAIRKAQPTPGDVHVNRPLTNISVAFSQGADQFIAGRIFPEVPVANQSDLYYIYDRENWIVGGAQKRGPTAESAGGGWTQSTDNYRCDVWALHKDVGDQVRANADSPLRPDTDATQWVTENMLITRETEWATNFFATGVWGTEQAGDATPTGTQFLFWSTVLSTPIEDIRAAKLSMLATTGKRANKLVVGPETWNVIVDHPDFIARINGGATTSQIAMVTRAQVAAILEIDEILVAEGVVNSANEGATESTGFILGKHALLVYAAPNPGLQIASAGYTFAWNGLLGAGASGTRISRFRMESIKSDRIEGESAYAHKVVAAELGHFFLNAVE